MRYGARKWIKTEDLTPEGSLFEASILDWIDEHASYYSRSVLNSRGIRMLPLPEIELNCLANTGEVLLILFNVKSSAESSAILSCEIRNETTGQQVLFIESVLVFTIDHNGQPARSQKE